MKRLRNITALPLLVLLCMACDTTVVEPISEGSSALISFSLEQSGDIRVELYNAYGKKMQTIVDGTLPAGNFEYTFPIGGYAEGLYFVTIYSGSNKISEQALLLKRS